MASQETAVVWYSVSKVRDEQRLEQYVDEVVFETTLVLARAEAVGAILTRLAEPMEKAEVALALNKGLLLTVPAETADVKFAD